jgi:hypothetical protein
MTEAAAGWYAHIAESIAELRHEVAVMEARGGTPREFGLKVRAHPDAILMATSIAKMGSGQKRVLQLNLQETFIETPLLKADRQVLDDNLKAVERLVNDLEVAGHRLSQAARWPHRNAGYLITGASWEPIERFLKDFRVHDRPGVINGDLLLKYMRLRTAAELANWDVLFAGVGPGVGRPEPDSRFVGVPLRWQSRTAGASVGDEFLLNSRYRVGSPADEKAGIDPEKVLRAEEDFRQREGKENVPGRVYRQVRSRPLLVVHLLKVTGAPAILGDLSRDPVAAFSISFPPSEVPGQEITYVVNETWIKQHIELFDRDEELFDEE